MRKAPPAWTIDRTARLLMVQGGLAPLEYSGLLQSFLTEAMALADVELRAAFGKRTARGASSLDDSA